MSDQTSNSAEPRYAIALVHGIGATDSQDMIRDIIRALEPALPGTQFHDYLKVYEAADGTQICQKESQHGLPITIASTYWGDISRVGEGVLGVLVGLLTNIFGLRFFAAAALRGGGPLRHVLAVATSLIVWISALLTLPLNIVTLAYSTFLLIGYFISKALGTTGLEYTFPAALIGGAVLITASTSLAALAWPRRHERRVYFPMHLATLILSILGLSALSLHYLEFTALGSAARSLMQSYASAVGDERWIRPAVQGKSELLHVAILSFLQLMTGVVIVLLSIAAFFLAVLDAALSGFRRKQCRANILALSSVIAAWLFVMMVTWPENIVTNLAVRTVSEKRIAYEAHWIEVVLMAFVSLIAVTGVVLYAHRRKSSLSTRGLDLSAFAPAGPGKGPVAWVTPRLIFSAYVQVLLVCLITISIVIALSHAVKMGIVQHFVPVSEVWVDLGASILIVAFVLAGPLFRYGAKTLMDIVDHFTVAGAATRFASGSPSASGGRCVTSSSNRTGRTWSSSPIARARSLLLMRWPTSSPR